MDLKTFLTKIFFTAVFVQVLSGLSIAQNARIDALGGNFCIDDISAIQWNPSASVNYNDMIQGSAYQDGTFGSVIGIKSLGKNLSVGISANTSADIQSSFYSDAKAFLDSTIDTTSVLPEKLPPYPHLITAVRLPFMTLGAEMFHEKTARLSTFTENNIAQTVRKEVTNTGMNVNAAITIGKLGIYPFFKYAVPVMSGEATGVNSDSIVHSTISQNRSIKCGMEFGLSPNPFNFTLGGGIFSENYVFQCDHLTNKRVSNTYITSIDLYGGVTTSPRDNLLLSIVYSYNHAEYISNTEINLSSAKQTSNDVWLENNHFAVASCELSHEIPSIDMSIIFRAGIFWYLSNTASNSLFFEGNYTYNESIKYPGNVSQVVPTLGIGLQKGIINFDIASKLAGWSGIVLGMPVVTGTITLDFSNICKRTSSDEGL